MPEPINTIIARFTDNRTDYIESLRDEVLLEEIPGFDSLARVEIAMEIEDEIATVTLGDETIDSWATLGDVRKCAAEITEQS